MRLYRFLKPYRMESLLALILLFGMVAADLVIPHLTQSIIDRGIGPKNIRVIITISLYMVGASMLSMIFALFNNYLSVKAAMGFGTHVRSALMRRIQTFSFGNLDRLQTGKLIVRSTSDITMVQTIVMLSLRILTRAPIWAAGAIVLLFMTSPRLGMIIGVFLILIVALMWIFARKAHPAFLRMQQKLDRLNTVLQENLAGMRVVKAFVRTDHETERFQDANLNLMNRTIRASQLTAVFIPFTLLLVNMAIVTALWLGGRSTVAGNMTTGELVAAINYLSFALFPILLLGGMISPLAAAEASAGRILEVLDTVPMVKNTADGANPLDVEGGIAFENVSFSYGQNGREPALVDVSLTAAPGETIAIMGATGSGKSTLVHLIPRFHDVTSGRITLDGTDIRNLDVHGLRGLMGVVLQESVLFSGTVRDNIRYGRASATDTDVEEAARAAQAHEFILALPKGYDTVLGQRGVTLSGGQRQRISIARALLVKPRILILDDATSALDVGTEARLQEALERFTAASKLSVTRFVVTQRISTGLLADKILLLDQSRIVAAGTHDQLMERIDMYKDIYRSQLGDPLEDPHDE